MNRRGLRRAVTAIAVGVTVAAVAAPVASARLVPPSARPGGNTYAAWDVIWGTAQAKRSLQSRNSLLAVRGNKCGFAWSQRVWLLPASINGLISVECHIPQNMFLVFPVAGFADWEKPPAELRASVKEGFSWLKRTKLTVDGRDLGPGHVTKTPIFAVSVPPNNGLGVDAGTVSVMSIDRFAVLSPLPRGEHTVTTFGAFRLPDGSAQDLGMTFHLTVGSASAVL
jgi:hypothetical protein